MRQDLGILTGSVLFIAGMRVLMAPYPNIEPIMLFVLPAALAYGARKGFLLGAGAMLASDFMLGLYGPWTMYTAPTYGAVGVLAGLAGMLKKNWSRLELAGIAFALTIFYDAVTAFFWAVQTMQPLPAVYAAQVPFTLLHLSNCVFAFAFAPTLMKAFQAAESFSFARFLGQLRAGA